MTDISVVIPCFNLGHTVAEAVDSILAQTRPAVEIVVVDDGSTDVATQRALASLVRPRLKIFRVSHRGAGAARNYGGHGTHSPYMLFLDADDLLDATYLEKAGARLDQDPELDIVSSAMQAFGGASYVWTPPACDLHSAIMGATIPITALFRRRVWDVVGGFDETLPSAMDLDFWISAFERGFRGIVLDEPLLLWRVRSDSLHHSSIARGDHLAVMTAIFEKHRGSIESLGIELLVEKDAFIVAQRRHRAHLEGLRNALRIERDRLTDEISQARNR